MNSIFSGNKLSHCKPFFKKKKKKLSHCHLASMNLDFDSVSLHDSPISDDLAIPDISRKTFQTQVKQYGIQSTMYH